MLILKLSRNWGLAFVLVPGFGGKLMFKQLSFAAIMAGALLAVVPAQATTINFDAGVNGPSYSESGVTFTGLGGGSFTTLFGPTPNGTFGLIVDNFNPIQGSFLSAVSMVSVDLGDFNADADDLFLRAYDSADNFLGQDTLTIPSTFTGLMTLNVSFAGISRVEFGGVGLNGQSNVYADNFSFDMAGNGVPEPAAWAMLVIGFGAMGGAMRARTRKAVSSRLALRLA